MGEFYPQRDPAPTYHRAASHGLQYASYDTCLPGWGHYNHASSGLVIDPAEIASLKAKISVLEFELTERQKEIVQAQSVITYLLKLNVCGTSQGMFCTACNAGWRLEGGDAILLIREMIKDLSKTLLSALSKHSGSGHSNREEAANLDDHTGLACGDLLDLYDTNFSPEGLMSKEKLWSGQEAGTPLKSLKKTQPLGTVGSQEVADVRKQTACATEEEFPFEAVQLPPLPYITRFNDAKNPDTVYAADSGHSTQDRSFHDKGIESLQSLFDISSSSLSGSTQCATSESSSLTSLNSSFNSSDDETGELATGSDKECPLPGGVVQKDTISSTYAPLLVKDCTTPSSKNPGPVVVGASSKVTQLSAEIVAALFMPRWPVKSFELVSGERQGAIFVHQRVAGDQEYRFPSLFKYGTRFRPEPMETNLYRTVVIDNLPLGIRLFTLLQHVKGGAVVDVKLLNTRTITGHLSAMITFVHEHGAKAFEQRVYGQPLVFEGVRARVTLLPTPTYPVGGCLRAAIANHGHTRCLEVRNFPRGIKPVELERDLRTCNVITTHHIESKKMRLDGVLELRFTSINSAGHAYGILISRKQYRQCTVTFSPDPCAQLWEEIPKQLKNVPDQADLVEGKPKAEDLEDTTTAGVTSGIPQKPENPHAKIELTDLRAKGVLTERTIGWIQESPDGCSLKTKESCNPQ
ncbi:MAG: hypothetical protein Q9225_005489 [Loekoesia sp. 1 TL-2023]